MDHFAGKTALVTGAASGIGLGLAQALGEEGMTVAMVDYDAEALAKAAMNLTERGLVVSPFVHDVSDQSGWVELAQKVRDTLGPVQVLCNNAGVGAANMPVSTLDVSVWNRFVNINLNGVFYGTHAFLPQMTEAGGGHIVNTASMAGILPGTPGRSMYGATKHAVVALSEVLLAELAENNIGVSVLLPGSVRTALWRSSRAAQGLEDVDTPPDEYKSGSANPDGLDPYHVGLHVVRSIKEGAFYIITAPELRPHVSARFARIEAAFDRAEASAAQLRGGGREEA
ncbi:SDR family oxidoreductase [Novosphingobium pentaromativorans]|uniref:Short-chain dehydrogenase/reductase SDR n=1 Tax=Novosphingobium pentaromativorans US6-1 TaxID=1088721 RepID=G6EAT6_9SPHN|nr:SDR family NAD(P)-dependent oxidoreductase [Novosphingobium pentaromativorans]EHJ61723.1 hypothetical protein NSU_1484 [Novosphingobium pentaromativorans US6-1]